VSTHWAKIMKLLLRKGLIHRFGQALLGFVGMIALSLSACSHSLFLSDASAATNPVIWTVSGLERIGRSDAPSNATQIQLSAARGEYEPFQIGIRAAQSSLTNVNVTVSDLVGSNNAVIAKSNLTLYREHYVNVSNASRILRGSTNTSQGPGWYTDGLIPFVNPQTQQDLTGASLDAVPFNLNAQANQPIWVDVFVPRDAPPGDYSGTFTVTSNEGSATGQIRLHVWNFELPLKSSLNSSFSFWSPIGKEGLAEFAKHKLMPATTLDPADQPTLINQRGLSSVRLPFWSGANIKTCRMEAAPAIATIRAEAAKYDSALLKYAYTADEIDDCPGLYEPLKQWSRNLHQANVKHLVVMTPVPELYDDGSGSGRSAVDIWVVLATQYEAARDRVEEVIQNGNQVWSYTALVQDKYSPKWQIEFDPINFRIMPGFINQSLNLTGTLYWRVDLWTNDPWNNVETYTPKPDEPYSGEGMLVYPGAQVGIAGIAPSMRLKWLREGVEDYEYVQILKNLGQPDRALAISRQMAPDWKNWTRDPKAFEAARQQLAAAIEREI
jgi:Domain of unknown function (DUF4091)/Family of unknown function (DUF6067)